MTGRVLGAGGRGVLVATGDPNDSLRDLGWLEDAGIDASTPRREGIVRCEPVGVGRPAVPRDLWAAARDQAAALRSAALVTAEGRTRVVARDGFGLEMGERSDPEGVRDLLDRPPPPRVTVFGGAWIGRDEPEYREAYRFGRLAAEAGASVVNGGYGGIMAAVSRGAQEAAGGAVGVTITSFSEQVVVNEWLTYEVEVRDLFARLPLLCDAEAWVAFPGGVGTLSEVALCWNLIQTASVPPRPLVIVGERWDRALRAFRELLLAERAHFDLVQPAATAETALDAVSDVLRR